MKRAPSTRYFAFDPFALAREGLPRNPSMYAKDVVARVLSETGESISPASISRLRNQLKKENE